MLSKRFYGAALMAAVVGVPALSACSSSSNPLCCTEFKVGATVDANIGGSAESKVAVQAVADLGGIAAAAIDDLTAACRGVAQDLGADQGKQTAADANADANAKMKAWCDLAFGSAGVFGAAKASAGGTITIQFQPPACEVSVSAQATCQGSCDVSGKCDIKANPPTCKGGTLEIDCKGNCTASAGATVSCTGTCSGGCTGSCTAQGGVACQGKCDGACSVATDAGGNCMGTCKGTCSVTPPGVMCQGTCSGKCDAACKGSATASVKCDGKCDADYQPISCSGGTLEGGCQVDAKCQANCNASAQAKADCTPPSVSVVIEGSANADVAGKLIATLKANLPLILAIKAKFSTMGDITANLSGNIGAVTDIKAACIPVVVSAVGTAVQDIGDTVSATATISGQIGGG